MKIKISFLIVFFILGLFAIAVETIDVPEYAIQVEKQREQAKTIEPQKTEPPETTIAFGGDVMLSRVVGQKMVKYDDFAWPFRKVAEIFSSADIAVINLESPFTVGKNHFVPTGSFYFNADPQAAAGLKLAGIDIISLANNHFSNQGEKGMTDTFKILKDSGIEYVGAGGDFDEAHQGKIIEKNGIKFGFLAYSYLKDLSGIANMDIKQIKRDITDLKKQVDITVIMMHAGNEYLAAPNQQQKDFARAAIDAGADLVIGHHPHWVQLVETYQGKPIFYSLGNLVFDQMWSIETRQGVIAIASFKNKKLKKIKIIPIRIDDYGQATVISNANEREIIFKRMGVKEEIVISN